MIQRKLYLLFIFLILTFVNGAAQSPQLDIRKIPFTDTKHTEIGGFHQDSTGLIWMWAGEKYFISDGEKIIPAPLGFSLKPDQFMRTMRAPHPLGNLYLGGDSLRIFNPYTRKIVQKIGFDPQYDLNGKRPSMWLFMQGDEHTIFAHLTGHGISELGKLGAGQSILQSTAGAPFKKVMSTQTWTNSQSVAVRDDQLFVSSPDTIWQYHKDGRLAKIHPFPSLGSYPLAAQNQFEAGDTVRFLHYVKDKISGKTICAEYKLAPQSEIFQPQLFPLLSEIACVYYEKMGGHYWLWGLGSDFYYFSPREEVLINYSEQIVRDNPNFSFDGQHFRHLFEDRTGVIWLSNTSGDVFTISSGKNLKPEPTPVQLLRVAAFDEKQNVLIDLPIEPLAEPSIHLSPNQSSILLDIFVADYQDASQNRYRWKLAGYDQTFSIPSSQNTIRYDHLPEGTYTLCVEGGRNTDAFEDSQRKIKIIVHRLWYTSWWAWAFYIILFLGAIYSIYQFQLRRKLKQAEIQRIKELEVLKSRLYTNITHEFRTPLTVIQGMIDQIAGHEKEKELLKRNSSSLLRLINQMLGLAKLESGNMPLNLIQADIIPYLRYLTESFQTLAASKQVELTFQTELKTLVMDYDEAKIQDILYNLLSNALKFSKEKGKVEVKVSRQSKLGGWQEGLKKTALLPTSPLPTNILITVSDTGIGIPEAELPHVFDRFYQVDGSHTRSGEGTGIGLAFTKELVRLMGGHISVTSELGKGTSFAVGLPIQMNAHLLTSRKVIEAEKATHISSTSMFEMPIATSSTEKPLLLIIEDNEDIVAYLEALLEDEYEIKQAQDGEKGILLALQIIPDIIISDVMMPQKDGFEVCETLKNDERTSHIPIVLLTGKSTEKDRIQGLKGGADAYLTKPFNKEELLVRLEKLRELRLALQQKYGGDQFLSEPLSTSRVLSLDERFLQKLLKVVEERIGDPDLGLQDLCEAVERSKTQVNRKLKALTEKTPSQFIRSIRLHKATHLLKNSEMTISEIAYDLGFSNPNYFTRVFSDTYGYPPSSLRK